MTLGPRWLVWVLTIAFAAWACVLFGLAIKWTIQLRSLTQYEMHSEDGLRFSIGLALIAGMLLGLAALFGIGALRGWFDPRSAASRGLEIGKKGEG